MSDGFVEITPRHTEIPGQQTEIAPRQPAPVNNQTGNMQGQAQNQVAQAAKPGFFESVTNFVMDNRFAIGIGVLVIIVFFILYWLFGDRIMSSGKPSPAAANAGAPPGGTPAPAAANGAAPANAAQANAAAANPTAATPTNGAENTNGGAGTPAAAPTNNETQNTTQTTPTSTPAAPAAGSTNHKAKLQELLAKSKAAGTTNATPATNEQTNAAQTSVRTSKTDSEIMELMEDAPAEQPEQQETHEECNINDILNESYKTVSGGEAEPAQVNESAQMSSQVGTPANSAPESLCSSIKKDGAQCRNKIRSNGKCHQHGG